MKKNDSTTRDYRVALDPEAERRTRLIRAASAGGVMLALMVLWWWSSPDGDEAAPEPAPPGVLQPGQAPDAPPGDERAVARVELPALTPPPVADGIADEEAELGDAVRSEPDPETTHEAEAPSERAESEEASAPAAQAVSLPPVSADGRFRVEMPDFAPLETVREAVRASEELGAPARILRRVVTGPFERRADAEAAIRSVREAHGLNGILVGSEGSGWRVQLGVFGAADNAEALRDTVRSSGLTAVIDARALIGPYVTRDAAETVRAALEEHAGLSGTRVHETR